MAVKETYRNEELHGVTDGGLRVSRRKALYALENVMDIHRRLNLDANGQHDQQVSCRSMQQIITTNCDMLASTLESELDRRGADYKPRVEVMDIDQ